MYAFKRQKYSLKKKKKGKERIGRRYVMYDILKRNLTYVS